MVKFFVLNLRLHSEEAAPVGGTSTPPANGSPAPAEAPVVVYGKPDEPEIPPSSAPAVPPVDRTAEYSTLKDKYKDLFEADFKSNLDRRMKGRDRESAEMMAIVDPLRQYFGMKDTKALMDFIKSDIIPGIEGGYKAPAATAPQEPGDGGAQAAPEALPSAADLATQGQALAEKLKDVPFDLKTELENPQVDALLKKGLNLEQAYTLTHHDEILLRETQKVAAAQKTATIEAIRTKGLEQVAEHIAKPSPQTVYKDDPNDYDNDDLDRIREQVMSLGKKIRL